MKQNEEFLLKATPKLKQFSEFVLKWQKSVNLISPHTQNDIWKRHIVDSAQIYPSLPVGAKTLLDMGSGAGFPGLVLAILNQENKGTIERFFLVESDLKKSIFLQEAVRLFQLPVTVVCERLEKITPEIIGVVSVDVVTARALKEVNELLFMGKGFITPETTCLFLKGERVDAEIKKISFPVNVEKIPSITHPQSCLLKITHVHFNDK